MLWSNSCTSGRYEVNLDVRPNTNGSAATSINASGEVVGIAYQTTQEFNNPTHAVRWLPSFRDLGTLGGKSSWASQVNNAGYIVGWADVGNGNAHAALWGPHTRAYDLGPWAARPVLRTASIPRGTRRASH